MMGAGENEITSMPSSDDPHTLYKAYVQFLAGATGSGIATATGFPMDTVKTRIQINPELHPRALSCLRSLAMFLKEWMGKEMVVNEGVGSLFHGLTPGLVIGILEGASLFATYAVCQDIVKWSTNISRADDLTATHNALAGVMTGSLITVPFAPLDLIKCRMQAAAEYSFTKEMVNKYRNPSTAAYSILRTDGLGGLYTGYSGILLKYAVGNACFFGSYEFTKSFLRKPGQTKDDVGSLGCLFSGGIAGVCYWLSVYPVDVIKCRVQIASLSGSTPSFIFMLRNTVKKEGIRPLHTGIAFCIARAFLVSGVHFVVYEAFKKILLSRVGR